MAYPRISVITVTRNDFEALQKTTESIQNQVYRNLEHVIVDGDSTDQTKPWLETLSHKNLVWKSEKDDGIYDAMNKGVRMCCGSWAIFMNAGDQFHNPNVVEEIFAQQQIDADLIYGDTIFISEDRTEEHVPAKDIDFLWQAMIFNHNSLFTRRSVLIEHPFIEQFNIVADSEFVIWAHQSGKSFHNAGIVVNTYQRGGYSDINSVMRTVERWKLVSDRRMKTTQEINDYYFQRLLWEDSCRDYLKKSYNVSI